MNAVHLPIRALFAKAARNLCYFKAVQRWLTAMAKRLIAKPRNKSFPVLQPSTVVGQWSKFI
jgi:hypothetical protein